MLDAPTEDNSNEPLINWSKWLITINTFAATGCIVGLKTAGESTGKVGVFFFIAILCFCASIVCATLFVFLIAKKAFQKNQSALAKDIWLAKLQLVFFTMGLAFVIVWIGFLSKLF